jgi:hypothetical protein
MRMVLEHFAECYGSEFLACFETVDVLEKGLLVASCGGIHVAAALG